MTPSDANLDTLAPGIEQGTETSGCGYMTTLVPTVGQEGERAFRRYMSVVKAPFTLPLDYTSASISNYQDSNSPTQWDLTKWIQANPWMAGAGLTSREIER